MFGLDEEAFRQATVAEARGDVVGVAGAAPGALSSCTQRFGASSDVSARGNGDDGGHSTRRPK